jgi:hypothetical protein
MSIFSYCAALFPGTPGQDNLLTTTSANINESNSSLSAGPTTASLRSPAASRINPLLFPSSTGYGATNYAAARDWPPTPVIYTISFPLSKYKRAACLASLSPCLMYLYLRHLVIDHLATRLHIYFNATSSKYWAISPHSAGTSLDCPGDRAIRLSGSPFEGTLVVKYRGDRPLRRMFLSFEADIRDCSQKDGHKEVC